MATYIETVQHQQSLILDGVQRMMDLRYYIAWMAKAKNGSVPADEATAMWNDACKMPGAVTDKLGPNPKFQNRVSIKTADLVIDRDAHVRTQGVEYKGKEIKNATQEDVDKLEARMLKGAVTKSTAARSRNDLAKAFVSASAASQLSGTGERELFSGAGFAAQACPDVED